MQKQDGVISCDEFYIAQAAVVGFRFCQKQPGHRECRAMSFMIDGGRFGVDLKYPDQIDPNQSFSARRP
jgi:hypothetical protein